MTARKVASRNRANRSVANDQRAGAGRPRAADAQGPVRIGVRVLANSVIAMGPGKADLLEAIAATGSISAAARAMGMSYRRAWLLVDTMNSSFREPLVLKEKGGTDGGGAELSAMGKLVLRKYRTLVELAAKNFSDLLSTPNVS
jgi:molybdate transport system regulatory protein